MPLNIKEKTRLSPNILLLLLIVLIVIVYSYILFEFPHQEGGDLFFHHWFTQKISESGSIPFQSPTSSAVTLYSYSPLFQIVSAVGKSISGLNLTNFFLFFNVLLVIMIFFVFFSLAKRLTTSPFIAFLSCLISFSVFVNYEFFYLLPKNFALLLFLIMLYLIVKGNFNLKKYILFFLISFALPLAHLPSLITVGAIIALILVAFIIHQRRYNYLRLLLSFIGGLALYFIFYANKIFAGVFPINPADPSFTASGSELAGLSSWLEIFPNLLFILLVLGVIFFAFKVVTKRLKKNTIIILIWGILSFLLFYQFIFGFNFLPQRNMAYFIFPASILISLVLYNIIHLFKKSKILYYTILTSFLVLTLSAAFSKNLSAEFPAIKFGIEREEINEINKINEKFTNKKIISGPITMYYLASLTDLKPAIEFEHTNLIKKEIENWELSKKLFEAGPKEAFEYSLKNEADYLVISFRTRDVFWENYYDFEKFNNSDLFNKVYQSEAEQYSEKFSKSYPYYTFYELAK